ncbi:MAG: minichromosome maintenance protein MCM, partial [Methanobacterium sp.]
NHITQSLKMPNKEDIHSDGSMKVTAALKLFFQMYHAEDIKQLKENITKTGRYEALQVDYYELNSFLEEYCHGGFFYELPKKIIARAGKVLDPKIKMRVNDIPQTNPLKELDTQHIDNFISTVAMVKNITPIKAKMKTASFECRGCMRLYEVPQIEGELKVSEPALCVECGGHSFRLAPEASEFINYRYVKLEEPLELRKSGATREFMAYMEEDLAGPTQTIKPGDVVDVSGQFDVIYNEKTNEWPFLLKIHNIKPLNSSFEDIDLTDEDIDRILELSKDEDIFKKFIDSIAPSVYGYENVKAGVTLQLFEGNKPEDESKDRWVIHILIIGDPGIGKSKLVKEIATMAPKGISVSGTGSSEVGLTASAVKDELTGKWAMEAGAIVLADSGLLCIDEFDKLSQKTMKSLNEPMESLTVSTAKAGLVQTMSARTSVLAAANPKYSKFDKYRSIKEQIEIPESTLSRFDLVYAMEDKIDAESDKHLGNELLKTEDSENSGDLLDPEIIKKYVAYAKNEVHPVLTEEAKEEIVKFYVETRQAALTNEDSKPITPRDMKAIERLSIARAKVELREHVYLDDAQDAIRIFSDALKTVGLEPGTAGALRGTKSNKEIEGIRVAEGLIKSYADMYGLDLPREAVKEIKEEIKVPLNLSVGGAEKIYLEAFNNIKKSGKY